MESNYMEFIHILGTARVKKEKRSFKDRDFGVVYLYCIENWHLVRLSISLTPVNKTHLLTGFRCLA